MLQSRREILVQLAGAGLARAAARQQQQETKDEVVASATADQTPRVGVVLSSFDGGSDHDGTKLTGLARPKPVDATLNASELDAMFRKAVELSGVRGQDIESIVEPSDWVVIKPDIAVCHDREGRIVPGSVTDPRLVSSLIAWLVEKRLGERITIAEGPSWRPETRVEVWTSDWNGAFGGFTYRKVVEEFSKKHAGVKFDIVDLNADKALELPIPGRPSSSRNKEGVFFIPSTIQQCDKLITIAPLKTHARLLAALSLGSYFGILPEAKYGRTKEQVFQLGEPHEILVDLYGYHASDYSILGGGWGLEGDGPYGPDARGVHHNVVIAGASALAVDTVGASVMGIDPARMKHLELASRKGYGSTEIDLVWTRGNEVEQARRAFRLPKGA